MAPDLVEIFGISSNIASWVASIGGIGLAIGFLAFSSLSDFFSEKKMIMTGILVFCLSSITGILFQDSYFIVVISRFIQAVGGISAAALYLVLIARYLPEKEQFIWMGLSTTSFSFSTMLGTSLGGYLATNLGWQYIFYVPFLGLLALPIIHRYLPDNPKDKGQIDYIGFGLLAIVTILINFLISNPSFILFILTIISIVVFWKHLNTTNQPFFSPDYFRNKSYITTLLATFFFYLAQVGLVVLVPFLMQQAFNANLDEVSRVFIIPYLVSGTLAAFSGSIINRIGLKNTLNTGGLLIMIGLIYGAYLGGNGFMQLTITLVLITCGYAMTFSPFLTQAISSLPNEEVGTGIGLFNFTVRTSNAIGISLVGYLLNSLIVRQNLLAISNPNMVIYANILFVFVITIIISLVLYNIRANKG